LAFNTVPWAVGAGAELDAGVARAFVNISTQDTEGINLPGDFKVEALSTPARAVNIRGGGMTLRNRQKSGQSYIGTADTDTQVSITANNSGGVRRDMVLARVRDPDFAPWQPYTDPQQILTGPYFEPFVLSGVGAGATTAADVGINYTAVPLARIDQPNGAFSITNAMITDLRQLARPRWNIFADVRPIATDQDMLVSDTAAWKDFPTEASWPTAVPYWATRAQVEIDLGGLKVQNAGDIDFRINFGGKIGPTFWFDYNGAIPTTVPGSVEVLPHSTYAEFDVANIAGTTQTVKLQGIRTYPGNNGRLWMEVRKQVRINIIYQETVV
jgi:hypothetical protein